MNLSNLKIGVRLGAGFGIMLLALAGLGWLAVDALSSGYATLDRTVNKDAVKLEAALDMQVWVRANSRRIFELATAPDEAMRKHVLERMAVNSQNGDKAEKRLADLLYVAEGKKQMEKVLAAKAVTLASYKKVEELAMAGKTKDALDVVQKETDKLINQWNATILEMGKLQRELLDKSVAAAKADYERNRNLTLAVVGSVIVLGLLFAWLVTRSITRPIGEAVAVAAAVAKGDLNQTIEVRAKDETGMLLQALKDMAASLKKVCGEVQTASLSIGTASGQIAAGNQDLSARTEEQASSLEETASSMEELTSTVKQNAENAKQANQLAVGASAVAAKGGRVVGEVVATMNGISESSKKISD
ncbi:MAG TPA: MCP four helix bundle domain-containing protein, partial [Burkholderiales bacterium]|nr:MCP four helix bundle domain-containing protein [Burkholderiales bacterium]